MYGSAQKAEGGDPLTNLVIDGEGEVPDCLFSKVHNHLFRF